MIATINPATGKLIRQFDEFPSAEIESRLRVSADAFEAYRTTTFSQRSAWLREAAAVLEKDKRQFAETMTLEMGKTIGAAIQELEKCALGCRYYAEHGERFLRNEPSAERPESAWTKYQPLGPILAIMPWNFPFWQVFRFAAPALMAGNVGLLKHASNVPQCALAIEQVFREAGFPNGIFQALLIGGATAESIIKDSRIAAVTLTGSVEAGRKVAGAAGNALKKSVLELGGSDPFIVLPSADFQKAVETAVRARTINNGQSCIAAKRFIIHKQVFREFQKRFVERMAALRVGNPMDPATDIGPLATGDVLNSLERQVQRSVQAGARLLLGGKPLAGSGFFYPPTVLTDIPHNSPAFNEELFGPVASLFEVDDVRSAIRLANNSDFGLGACIWTNDKAERERFIEEIQSGLVFVNGMVVSMPALPFGGIKQSGYGRELSHHGIREFVNVKAVVIEGQPSANRSE